jgi:hypothetical protein
VTNIPVWIGWIKWISFLTYAFNLLLKVCACWACSAALPVSQQQIMGLRGSSPAELRCTAGTCAATRHYRSGPGCHACRLTAH